MIIDKGFDYNSLDEFEYNWSLTKKLCPIIETSEARKTLIDILEVWDNVNEDAKPIWLDLIERAGFYPYYNEKIINTTNFKQSLQSKIRNAFFKSDYLEGVYFHEKQKQIELAISKMKNVAVSAPTSFGKSLLIEEFVARKEYQNILILQPTLALIDETRKKLSKYDDFYNIVINTKQNTKENNIFIFTAERALEFTDLPNVDFFIVDEFYKVSKFRNDDRVDALNIAIMMVMGHCPQALFLTPTISVLSEKFIKKYDINFFNTDYSLVNTDIIDVNKDMTLKGKSDKEKLFELLDKLTEPSIVYVRSPNEAYTLANEYIEYQENRKLLNPNLPIYEWMNENISEKWKLKELMKHGIGAHNGALPRHIVSSEIELFNNGRLNIMFATASLIEGVNTVAKNILIYSTKKGIKKIDYFDFSNIMGRAGRMGKYYSGKVYLFDDPIPSENLIIDVPFIDQKDVSDEILFNIPEAEANDIERKNKLEEGIPDDLKPILKENIISVQGQKNLYKHISENIDSYSFLKWQGIPEYNVLCKTLCLAYKYLEMKNNPDKYSEKVATMSLRLVNHTIKDAIAHQENYYQEHNKSYQHEDVINEVLKFVRYDAGYKIPKLLSVVDSIQRYVFSKNGDNEYGDYGYFCSALENGKGIECFAYLIDYGVPASCIKKIEQEYKRDNAKGADVDLTTWIKEHKKYFSDSLLTYEYDLLKNAIHL